MHLFTIEYNVLNVKKLIIIIKTFVLIKNNFYLKIVNFKLKEQGMGIHSLFAMNNI